MLDKFDRLDEFEHLLMDDVGEVVAVEHRKDETPVLVIRLEDGSTARAPASTVVNWKVDVVTGRRELAQAQGDRRLPPVGSPVTFGWNSSQTAPNKVLVWRTRLFDFSWPKIKLLQQRRRGQGVDVLLWEGRDPRKMRQECDASEIRRGTLEVNWAGRWLPYKQVFA